MARTLIVAGVTAVVAVGTYYGLNIVKPHKVVPGEMPPTAKVEEVFTGTADPNAPPDPETTEELAAAPTPDAPGTAPSEVTETEPEPVAAETAPAPAEHLPEAESVESGTATGEEPDPMTAAPSELASAPEPAPVEPAPAPTPEPTPAPEPAPVEPAPAVAEARPPPKPAEPARAVTRRSPPSADVVGRWWGEPGKQDANQLNVTFAGQAAGEKAIAVMFDKTFSDASSAAANIQVLTQKGQSARGRWELGANPRMLLFRGVGSGRYTLVLAPELSDARGTTLGRKLSGPVYIQ